MTDEKPLDDIHDFDDTVIAVLDDTDESREAVSDLAAAGYDVEVLQGERGKEHLDLGGESGPLETIERLIDVFGDQYRILERLHSELEEGNMVVSVDAEPDEATEAVEILQDQDAEFMWRLGTWTYTRVGD